MKKKTLLLFFLCGALIVLFLINHIFLTTNLYLQISWLDIPMHFGGGFLLGLIGIYFLSFCFNVRQTIPPFFVLIAALITALAVGLMWEIIEFNSETILNLKLAETITNKDTQDDLFFDAVGAFTSAIICIFFKKINGRKSSHLLGGKN